MHPLANPILKLGVCARWNAYQRPRGRLERYAL